MPPTAQSPADPPKPVIVAALGFGQIIGFASSFYLLGILADPIARSLGLATGLLFDLMSGAFLISALAAAPVGRWLDRRGGREALIASNLVFAAGLILMASATADAPGAARLIGGMLMVGAGMSIGLYETAFAILVARYGQAARRPITIVALMGGLGSSIGWPTTQAMEQAFGWRGACLGWAGAHLLVCLPMALLIVPRTGGRAAPGAATTGDAATGAGPVQWDRRMVQLAALFAGAWFVSVCMSSHLPRLLTRLGLTPAQAAATAALTGLAAVTVRLLELTVLRRLPPLATTRVATLMHPLGAALALMLGARGVALLALGQGAGNGMLTVAKGVLPLTLYGPENYGYRSGLLSTPARFLQAAGPAVYGLLLDRGGPGLALAVSGGVCLAMFVLSFGLVPAPSAARVDQAAPAPNHPVTRDR